MICPYTVDTVEVKQYRYEYDDNNLTTFVEEIYKTKRTEHDCKKTNCGAWADGKCNYKSEW